MADDQPLTCVRCWHAPASRLLVIRWRDETFRLLCTECAAKDEAEAPGLPNFRSLTVLIVWPEHAAVPEWGYRRRGSQSAEPCISEKAARYMAGIAPDKTEVVTREVTPWAPVPGGDEDNA